MIPLDSRCSVEDCDGPGYGYGMGDDGRVGVLCEAHWYAWHAVVSEGFADKPYVRCSGCGDTVEFDTRTFDEVAGMLDNRDGRRPEDPVFYCKSCLREQRKVVSRASLSSGGAVVFAQGGVD